MRQHDATIDFKTSMLTYTKPGATRRRELRIQYKHAAGRVDRIAVCRRVYAGATLKIPARCERVVDVTIEGAPEGTDVLFTPADATRLRMNALAAAPMVARVLEGRIRVPVMNVSGKQQKIRRIKELGDWTPLD